MNITAIAVAALVPIIIGFLWYSPFAFAKTWMKESNLTEEDLKGSNMVKILVLTLIFSFLIALTLCGIVIHQGHIVSTLMNEPGYGVDNSPVDTFIKDFMAKYGNNFRTFKHGAFHGTIAGIFLAMPLVGINALFERKSFRYILLHAGYWTICFMIMGGIICAWK